MLHLVCGDPEQEPKQKTGVSYSRFVLPFAYVSEPLTSDGEGPAFQPADLERFDLEDRRAYMTWETARVLFDRARWLRLKDPAHPWPRRLPVTFRDGFKCNIGISAPWLVLFEWSGDAERILATDPLRTGFLIVETHFAQYEDAVPKGRAPILDDLLELNELFRYWRRPFSGHEEKGYKALLGEIHISLAGEPHSPLKESDRVAWMYTGRFSSLLDLPVQIDGKAWRLVPAGTAASGLSEDCAAYADHRCFVWTCAAVQGGGKRLAQAFGIPATEPWRFGHWVKLLNVDLPEQGEGDEHLCAEALEQKSHKCTEFEQEWAKERTYRRWAHDGTFYGFTYHSAALLTRPDHWLPVWRHFGEIYFDQVLLLLYLRVTVFQFSRRLTEFSEKMRDRRGPVDEWQREFQRLRLSFTVFTNLYQFPLISNQQQGLELYSLSRKSMDVDDLYAEVQEEIHHTHDYLAAQTSLDLAHTTTRLTVVATLGLAFALAAGFLGMNILQIDKANGSVDFVAVEWLFGALGVSLLLILAVTFLSSPLAYLLQCVARCGEPVYGALKRLGAFTHPWR